MAHSASSSCRVNEVNGGAGARRACSSFTLRQLITSLCAALALARMNTQIDVRNILSTIRVPTLILHRTGDLDANIEERGVRIGEAHRVVLEHEPLVSLARDGELSCFTHEGFWQPMDTARDRRLLEELWASGNPPWLREYARLA